MEHSISSQTVFAPAQSVSASKSSILKKFMKWCESQEQYRFLWLGISLFGQIGMIVPLTLLAVLFFANNNFTLWIIVCSVNVPVLALNLAAQPPKVTLPTMFFALLVNVIVMALCGGMYLS